MKHFIGYFAAMALIFSSGGGNFAYASTQNAADAFKAENSVKFLKEVRKTESDRSAFKNAAIEKQLKRKQTAANIPQRGVPTAMTTPSIELQSVRPLANDENARITLDVQMVWSDGSGYQMLIDADATLLQSGYYSGFAIDMGALGECEYTMPADAAQSGASVTAGTKLSIDIPDGVYDYAVANYTMGMLVIPSAGDGVGDDMHFVGGYEYVFTIEAYGSLDNCVLTCDGTADLAVTAISSPTSGYNTDAETVTATIENVGESVVQQFVASYSVDGGAAVYETVNEAVEPGGTLEYTFKQQADLSAGGLHTVKVSVEADGDAMTKNNSMTVQVNTIQPMELPYTCGFDESEDAAEWNVIDANEDGVSWYMSDGVAAIDYNMDSPLDDYLVMVNPVSLPVGYSHVTVTYNAALEGFPESFEILYGTSADVEQMTVLRKFENVMQAAEAWVTPINLEITEAGDYFFAINATSQANMYGLMIDEFAIAEGRGTGNPDLTVAGIELPLSSCSLTGNEEIGATIVNDGSAAVTSFTLECHVNGTLLGSQKFDVAIAEGESARVTFDKVADMSQPGVYEVTVTITGMEQSAEDEPEVNTGNNTAKASVTHFTPADVPFSTDFSDETQRADWVCEDVSWTYDETAGAMNCYGPSQLFSRGINLEGGKTYRLTYTYMAGALVLGYVFPESYTILYGRDGEPLSERDVLQEVTDDYTEDAYVSDYVNVKIDETGVYSFGFKQDEFLGLLYVKSISVTEVAPYDVKIERVAGLPSMLPVGQAGALPVKVNVLNRGSETVSGEVTVTSGGKVVGTAEYKELAADDDVMVTVTASMPDAEAGNIDLKVSVSITGQTDSYPGDNEAEASIELTDDVLAYDHATDEMYNSSYAIRFGEERGTAAIGIYIGATTSMKAFSVGWGAASGEEIGLHVYEWNPDAEPDDYGYIPVGKEVLGMTASQGTENGQIEYVLDEAPVLAPGDYLLGVKFNSGLVADGVASGLSYAIGEYATGERVLVPQPANIGTVAIRAILDDEYGSVDAASMPATSLMLYPNPVSETLTVKSSGEAIDAVEIYSASGNTVCGKTAVGGDTFGYDASGLAPGLYFARVTTATGVEVIKFVVK